MEKEIREDTAQELAQSADTPSILEEITIEELAVDGICGIY